MNSAPSNENNSPPPTADVSVHHKRGKKKIGGPPQKRGNKGNFSPGRLTWLREQLPAYNAYADSKQKKKIGSGRSFWCGMLPDYHTQFPWRLSLKEDMPDDPEDAAALARDPENDEEIAEKTRVVEDTETKIMLWFSRQRRGSKLAANPFVPVMKELRVPRGPAPKRIPDHQFYLSHEDFHDKIAREFQRRGYDARPAGEQINLRCQVAKSLLAQEPVEVQERVHTEAVEEHDEQLRMHKEASDGLPSAEPAAQAEARDRATVVVQGMLDILQRYTGWELVLFAGRIDSQTKRAEVTSWTADAKINSPAYLDFSKANGSDYETTIKAFSSFVAKKYLKMHASAGDQIIDAASAEAGVAAVVDLPPPAAVQPAGAIGAAIPPAPAYVAVPDSDSASTTDPAAAIPAVANVPSPGPSPAAVAPSASAVTSSTTIAAAPAPAPDAYATWKAIPGRRLRSWLESLPQADRMSRTAIFCWSSQYELDIEENKLRNRELLASLGLDKPMTWMGTGAHGKKRKATGKNGGHARKQGKRDDDEEDDSEKDSEDEDTENEDGDEEEGDTPEPRRSQRRVHSNADGGGWAQAMREVLDDTELGQEWRDVVGLWFQREQKNAFSPKGKQKFLSAKLRPKQIGEWVGRARSQRYDPGIKDAARFGELVWTWWRQLSPAWTEQGGKAERREVSAIEADEWKVLDVSGQNGFVNVLVCLKWWARAASNAPGENWLGLVHEAGEALQLFIGTITGGKAASESATASPNSAGGQDVQMSVDEV